MSDRVTELPPEQEAIRAKCFHPSGTFVEFKEEEVEQSIPERFNQIVRKYSNQLAVKAGGRALTYSELNQQANRIARAILARRGEQNEPIALLLGHAIDLVSAIFGVLKAGKFFLILNPDFPPERNKDILAHSGSGLIITNGRKQDLSGGLYPHSLQWLDIDGLDAFISDADLDLSISPDALSYLIYTSGSTGKPKGVIQNHRNLLHASRRRINAFRICSEDRMTLLSSGSNQAVMNILSALLAGARLCPFNVKQEGTTQLVAWLMREGITIYHSSASVFRQFLGTLTGNEDLSSVRLVRSASEAVTRTEVELYRKYFSSKCIFANGLSTTETGTSTFYFIDKDTSVATETVPVGYPLQDMEVFLFDEDGNRVGFNCIGEIAIRSRYLAMGYWREPDLTQTQFKPDPDGGDKRTYLTGDFGRISPDGCLEHLGRKEFLVKVQGNRVETGEVERNISNHPGVAEVAVVGRETPSGDGQLIAYVVPAHKPGPSVTELRRFLKQKLPEYMVPSYFVMMDALPLTLGGKVDRKNLPDPGRCRPQLDTAFVAAGNTVEEQLADIWASLLGIDQVGVHDQFFDLGGHSLLASRIVTRIAETFRVEISLAQFFQASTVAAVSGLIDRSRKLTSEPRDRSMADASVDEHLPLSFAQQRLWFLDELEPGSSTYNVLSAYKVTGRLDVATLERSFDEILKRHETLRSVFKTVRGQPYQTILPSATTYLPVIDLQKIGSSKERETELRRLIRLSAQQPFDLARGPLLRVSLVRLAEEEHVLLLVIHHIVFDGWSTGVLCRELSALYEAFTKDRDSPLPELSVQYKDFARWQRLSLQGEVIEKQLAYWHKQLKDLLVLDLPTDRPRPSVQASRGGRLYFTLSKTDSAGLKSLSIRHGVTLFMTLLAAYQTLLHRYTAQHEIVIGTPIAGRNRSELEGLIGLFLNMLVLRIDFSGEPTFQELLARVRKICLEAYAHQDLPFEKLVEELQPQRSLSHNPLFQVTFAYQNTPRFPLQLTGITSNELEVETGIAKFDLHLFMEEKNNKLRGWLDYNADLFDRATIERMLAHFRNLLKAIVAKPDVRLSDLPILTDLERHQLLVEWNDTKTYDSGDKCIHELFEAQVERTPDAVAVVFEGRQLTYRELNQKANQLAHYLRKHGVGPEVLVGICMQRSLELIVGLLGILKTGGAYVPLDPEYPKERLAFMLKDSRASVLLTQQCLVVQLTENRRSKIDDGFQSSILDPPTQVICLDTEWQAIARESEASPGSGVQTENLAYVIYTSGSTGRPKGVLITHHNVTRLFQATHSLFDFHRNDVWTLSHSYAFDFSVWEIFGALLHGGRLVVVPGAVSRSPEMFYDLLCRERVTVLNQTPPAFRQLIEAQSESRNPQAIALRWVIFGGEALDIHSLRPWFDRHGDRCPHLVNMFGITETTVHVTHRSLTAADLFPGVGSLIGGPLADLRVYILDANQKPVPIGVPGELYVGGPGVGRGYLNRPELTAERFIPNPFSGAGERLYRSGDLARYRSDGDIEFLRRTDHQIKLRGYRIELGEIESVLGQHPAVRQAVVVAREDNENPKPKTCTERSRSIGNLKSYKSLVAYVVLKQEHAPTINELRSFLKEKLPGYMIPSAFVLLDILPLTHNGKVDRKALPVPDQKRPEPEEGYVAPRTPVEELLAEIWADLLKLDKVGIHDNFFDLGGHSLLATQVISRVRNTFQVEVPVRSLFEMPTVVGLENAIEEAKRRDTESLPPQISIPRQPRRVQSSL